MVAAVPREFECEWREHVVEAVGHDHVVVDGHDGGESAHGEPDASSDRRQPPDSQRAKAGELAKRHLK